MRRLTLLVLCVVLSGPVAAKPPLSQVASIDDGLMVVAIADEIRKRCDGINARMIRAVSTLQSLKSKARDLGYSEDEIDDYVTSKSEKRRMRAKAQAYLASKGVNSGDTSALCGFGKAEIGRSSAIGRLLR